MIVLENSISQNGAEFVALVETEKKKPISFFLLLLPSPPFKQFLCVEIVEVIPTRETAPGSLIIQFKSVAILPKREMCSAIKIQLSVMIFDQNSNKNDSELISI